MKALVTGGAGFIGSHIVDALVARGDKVFVLDNFSTGSRDNIPHGVSIIESDIRDKDILKHAMRDIDAVFHLAAAISVPESISKPHLYEDINVNGTLNIIHAARKSGVRRIVFSSSAAVYGDTEELPVKENTPLAPQSPYAVNKYAGECYLNIFQNEKFSCVSLRYFNVFGPRQKFDSPYAAVIPIFMSRILNNKPLTVFGDGSFTRDFIYVDDIVAANIHALTCSPGVYNIGTGKSLSIGETAAKIAELTTPSAVIEYTDARDGDIAHSYADISRICATGWKPEVSFDTALKKTWEFYSGMS